MFIDKSSDIFNADKTEVNFTAEINNCGRHTIYCNANGCKIDFANMGMLNFEFDGSNTYFVDALAKAK